MKGLHEHKMMIDTYSKGLSVDKIMAIRSILSSHETE